MRSNQEICDQAAGAAAFHDDPQNLIRAMVDLLKRERPYYNWVGVYLLRDGMLELGPYLGKPTPHTRIPLHQGICGAAASSGKTIIIDDVNQDSRYLACSLETRSEIVAPILWQGRVLGEIDIDSDAAAAFSAADKELLEAIAALIAPKLV